MRTLTSALIAQLGLTITQPGYLVEIDFSAPARLSTLGDISWNGYTWAAANVKVAGINWDEKNNSAGSITLGNAWLDYGALALNQGVADRAISVYAVYPGATATGDVVCVFCGVGDSAEIGNDVKISLAQQGSRTLFAPRRFINASAGFNTLMPAGTRVTVGGQPYILERA